MIKYHEKINNNKSGLVIIKSEILEFRTLGTRDKSDGNFSIIKVPTDQDHKVIINIYSHNKGNEQTME